MMFSCKVVLLLQMLLILLMKNSCEMVSNWKKIISEPNYSAVVFTELPYGWEKIDDPIYGSYYVE